MTYTHFRRSATLLLTAALVAATIAACGSSSTTSTSTSSAAASGSGASATGSGTGFDRSEFVACLKAHGVTLPARPARTHRPAASAGAGQGLFFGGGGAGGRRFANNPKLRAAFQACGGTRAFPGRRRFALSHAAVTKFVACVRQHGYDLPSPNFSGTGPIFPAGIAKNAKFQTAARACQADLRPAGAAAPGAPPGGSTTTTSGA